MFTFSVAKSYRHCYRISDIDIDTNLPMTRLLSYINRLPLLERNINALNCYIYKMLSLCLRA